jgi:hypothetical protein
VVNQVVKSAVNTTRTAGNTLQICFGLYTAASICSILGKLYIQMYGDYQTRMGAANNREFNRRVQTVMNELRQKARGIYNKKNVSLYEQAAKLNELATIIEHRFEMMKNARRNTNVNATRAAKTLVINGLNPSLAEESLDYLKAMRAQHGGRSAPLAIMPAVQSPPGPRRNSPANARSPRRNSPANARIAMQSPPGPRRNSPANARIAVQSPSSAKRKNPASAKTPAKRARPS